MQNETEQHNKTICADFQHWLQREFMVRCKKNPRYSLRAFAQLLGMDSSSVSQMLAGRRKVSQKLVERICNTLDPDPEQKEIIMKAYMASEKETPNIPDYRQLLVDSFTIISEWYHYAILELTYTNGFQSDPQWIGRKLGISPVEIKAAIERLKNLGLLSENKGKLIKTQKFITNIGKEGTSPALKELQRQVLTMALDAIDNTPQEEKDITSMTMSIDVSKLDEARKLITKFRRSLCHFLEDGQRRRIYQLGIQLYPVSKFTQEKE